MAEILFNVHKSYRWVVAICDKDVYGRRLIDGDMVLDLGGRFFDGEALSKEEARKRIEDCVGEDATFNIAGAKAIEVAKEAGIVSDEGVREIDGVPFALVLL